MNHNRQDELNPYQSPNTELLRPQHDEVSEPREGSIFEPVVDRMRQRYVRRQKEQAIVCLIAVVVAVGLATVELITLALLALFVGVVVLFVISWPKKLP